MPYRTLILVLLSTLLVSCADDMPMSKVNSAPTGPAVDTKDPKEEEKIQYARSRILNLIEKREASFLMKLRSARDYTPDLERRAVLFFRELKAKIRNYKPKSAEDLLDYTEVEFAKLPEIVGTK